MKPNPTKILVNENQIKQKSSHKPKSSQIQSKSYPNPAESQAKPKINYNGIIMSYCEWLGTTINSNELLRIY